MSRPRRPFGSNRPGQLPATRIKILAAELADPQRLSRARTYASDGSVLDVTVEPKVVTATVLGSRADPYLVELAVAPGFGPPTRAEVSASCSCPDTDKPWGAQQGWCKHALAALLVVADEVAIEPDVLGRWRATTGGDAGRGGDSGHNGDVVPIGRGDPAPQRATPHPVTALLDVPDGATIPVIDDIEPVTPTPLGDPELDRWVTTAMSVLTRRD